MTGKMGLGMLSGWLRQGGGGDGPANQRPSVEALIAHKHTAGQGVYAPQVGRGCYSVYSAAQAGASRCNVALPVATRLILPNHSFTLQLQLGEPPGLEPRLQVQFEERRANNKPCVLWTAELHQRVGAGMLGMLGMLGVLGVMGGRRQAMRRHARACVHPNFTSCLVADLVWNPFRPYAPTCPPSAMPPPPRNLWTRSASWAALARRKPKPYWTW